MDMWSFDSLVRTFKYIAIFSTVLFTIKFIIFSFIGGDSEVGGDFNVITDTDSSFDFFSIQSIFAFLMGFGWIGLASLTQWKLSIITAVIIASLVGLLFMFLSAYLMLKIKSFNQIIKPNYENCIGKIGKAYTNIHPHSEGQIEIEINGKLSIKQAYNDSDNEINAFEIIKVIKFENETIYITKE